MVWLVLGVLILVNVLSLRYFLRFDLTKNQQYSISESTIGILSELDDIVEVKAYFSSDLPPQFIPVQRYVKDLLGEYAAYGSGNFDFEFVDPNVDFDAAQEARKVGVEQVRMQVRENDSFQVKNGYMGIGIFYAGNAAGIPVVQQSEIGSLEYDLTSLIVKMSQQRVQTVAFLQGHGEHEISQSVGLPGQQSLGLSTLNQVLSQTYKVSTVDFAKQQTLDGVDVLIVAGAKRDLTERDVFEIDQFLLKGGKAIFLVDAIQQIQGGTTVENLDTNLNTLFEPLGVTVNQSLMLDKISELAQFSEGPGRVFFLQYPAFIRLVSQNFSANPIVAKMEAAVVRFVSHLTITQKEGLDYDAFMRTSEQSWHQVAPFNSAPNSLPAPEADKSGSQAVVTTVSGLFPRLSSSTSVPPLQRWSEVVGEDFQLEAVIPDQNRTGREILTEAQAEASIIIMADSDFVLDPYVRQNQTPLVLVQNMVDSLTFGDALISIRSKTVGSDAILPQDDSQRVILKWVGVLLVPVLISLLGFFRLWMRRKEEKMLSL